MSNYTINVDARNNTGGVLKQISGQLNSIDESAKRVKSAMGAAAGAAVAFATGSIARGIISQYTAYEKYNTVLATYLGSQRLASSELQRLQTLANSLPQDLGDITQAFVLFTSRGLNTSSKALTAFSNIATANGKSLTQLGEAVADAMTGEFERLKEFGIKVSKENGKFVADVGNGQKIIAKSSAELVTKLQALGEAGGKFGDAAANNSDTLSQSFSNLQGSVLQTSITIGQQLKPALKEVADLTANWLNTHQELVKAMSKQLGSALVTSIHAIASALTIISANMAVFRTALVSFLGVKIFGDFQQIVQRVTRDTDSASQTAVKFSVAARGMGVAVADLGVKSVKSTTMLSKLGSLFKDFVKEIPFIGGALTTLGGKIAMLGPLLLNPWLAIPAAILTAVTAGVWFFRDESLKLGQTTTTLGETIGAIWFTIGNYVGEIAGKIAEWMSAAWTTITNGIGYMGNRFYDVMTGIGSAAKTGVNWIIGAFTGFFQFMTNNLTNLPAMFLQAFQSAFKVVGEFVKRSIGAVGELWDYIKSFGENEISNTFTGLGDVISGELDKVAGTVTPIDWKGALGADYVGETVDAMGEKFGTFIGTLGGVETSLEGMVLKYRESNDQMAANAASMQTYDDAILRIARSQDEAALAQAGSTAAVVSDTAAKAGQLSASQQIIKTLLDEQVALKDLKTALANVGAISAKTGIPVDQLTKKFQDQIDSIEDVKNKAQTVSGIIKTTWSDMSSEMSRGISESILAGKGAFKSFSDYLKNWANEVVTRIMDKMLIQPMLDQMASWGSSLLGGLFKGGGGAGGGGGGGGLLSGIAGLFGGGGGGGGLGGLFAGLFADGGRIPGGQFGVVGEAGPELISGPANITPMSGATDSGALTVNFNITAIDTQTGTQFILDHKKEIEGVIQSAYNRRGKQGIY